MPKPSIPDPSETITKEDIDEFIATNSDFAFEMRVVAQLRSLQFECLHSGTYHDPITDKIREFDIRASREHGGSKLRIAVECKNLRPDYPLLLSAVPRTTTEAFHEQIVWLPNAIVAGVKRFEGETARYKVKEMLGKKMDQVKRVTAQGPVPKVKLVSEDSPTFEKLNQAIHSCRDLVRDCVFDDPHWRSRVAVPVLVVPNNLLWQVDYADDGKILTSAHRVPSATMFINNTWSVERGGFPQLAYRLSHLEIVTIDALPAVVDEWLGPSGFFPSGQ